MESWVDYWVLTMSYCLSPEGKTACEQVEDTYLFTGLGHCMAIREEMVTSYGKYTNVILYEDKTTCEPLVEPLSKVSYFTSREEADSFAIEQLVIHRILMEDSKEVE